MSDCLVRTDGDIIKKWLQNDERKLGDWGKDMFLVLPRGLNVLEEMLKEESEKCRCPECHMEMGCYSHFCEHCKERVGVVLDNYLPPDLIVSVFAQFKKENVL